MTIFHWCICLLTLCCIGTGLDGCATINGQLSKAHLKLPVKIMVVQAPMTIAPGRLQKVLAPNVKGEMSASEEPIAQGVKQAQSDALLAMESRLAKRARFIVVTPTTEEKPLINVIYRRGYGVALSQNEADRIRTTTGADALLRFKITDYGLTPRSWRKGYITFEVTTTLALAGAIAYTGATVAKGAAGAYLAQETVEETAEGYAGFRALDVVCRPVRIEAELIRLNPVATVWKAHDTGLADVHLSRLTRKVGFPERDDQLKQATDDAVTDIVTSLTKVLAKSQT